MTNHSSFQNTELLTTAKIRMGIRKYDEMTVQWAISQGQQGAITGMLANVIKSLGFEGDAVDDCRHLILGYLTLSENEILRPISSKELTDGQWVGIGRWQSYKSETGKYYERATYAAECTTVLYQARHDLKMGKGRLPLFGMLKYWENMASEPEYYNIDSFREYVAMKSPTDHKKQLVLSMMEAQDEKQIKKITDYA